MITNRIADFNVDLLKLSKKIESIEQINETLEQNLNEEAKLRQNIEKKTFMINENFTEKLITLKNSFDTLAHAMTDQIDSLKNKILHDVIKNNQNFMNGLEESLRRVEHFEKRFNETDKDLNKMKNEQSHKLNKVEDLLHLEIKQVRHELLSYTTKVEMLEKRICDNTHDIKEDLKNVCREVNLIKNEIEMMKSFKHNIQLDLKDLSGEVIRIEEDSNSWSHKISCMMKEVDAKLKHFEANANVHNENFLTVKTDIYNQLHDNQKQATIQFQKLIDDLNLQSTQNLDELNLFRTKILQDNEKFSSFVSNQLNSNNSNMKRLLDYSNEDIELIKTKCTNTEEMVMKVRGEFFHNLNEVEEFLIKKYESIFRELQHKQ